MVTCDNQSAPLGGFRLGAREDEPRRARAPSVSSLTYKHKIDALFDDTRSLNSHYAPVQPLEREPKVIENQTTSY